LVHDNDPPLLLATADKIFCQYHRNSAEETEKQFFNDLGQTVRTFTDIDNVFEVFEIWEHVLVKGEETLYS
jgi:hypothetical protein